MSPTTDKEKRTPTERDEMQRQERIRLVIADWGEGTPTVIGALSRSTWEIFGEEEWMDMRRKAIDALGMHSEDFEVREIEITLDRAALVQAVATPILNATVEPPNE